ncbi:MAG: NERD domain-containing protein [Firmicutes bacterium]|nr:NERD domain-containing protein [Bacillota bacterium]
MPDSFNTTILFAVVLLFAVILFAVKYAEKQSPKAKGAAGEQKIGHIIQKEIDRGLKGCILHNLYIPRADGSTTEIDVLLISVKGLFVFESKNYAGYIFGNDHNQYWTVSLYAGKNWYGKKQTEKHSFYNPVWQNNTHVNSIRKLLTPNLPNISIYSIIVFSDRGSLMNIEYDSLKTTIINTSQLARFISDIHQTYSDVLTEWDIEDIYNDLAVYTQSAKDEVPTGIPHSGDSMFAQQKCPCCGGDLILRTARKGVNAGGQFLGCSNYPKCKYTRNL